MKPSEALRRHRDTILAVATGLGATNVRVFGSARDGTDGPGSDLDLLVDVPRGTTLFDMARAQAELRRQLGVPVDLLTPNDLPAAARGHILAIATPV